MMFVFREHETPPHAECLSFSAGGYVPKTSLAIIGLAMFVFSGLIHWIREYPLKTIPNTLLTRLYKISSDSASSFS